MSKRGLTGLQGEHWIEVRIETSGFMPSPRHCRVVRHLCNYQTGLDSFIAILREAAEGLTAPQFTQDFGPDYDYDNEGSWAVEGYRIKTPEDETEAERIARFREVQDREILAALKEKYESGRA